MKEKVLNLKWVAWLTNLPISKKLSSHRVLGKLFNYEMITYIICGFLTTVVNYVSYFLIPGSFRSTGIGLIIANIFAWIMAVAFAFVVNKIFVFDSPSWKGNVFVKELIPFVTCRLLSLLMDTAFVYVTVSLLHLNEPLFKLISNVFVLIVNYVASKLWIFKKPKEENTL